MKLFLKLCFATTLLLHFSACGSNEPAKKSKSPTASSGSTSKPDHANLTEGCTDCHEKDRKSSDHGKKMACESCHKYDATKKWGQTFSFTHDPKPTKCESCHINRPTEVHSRAYPTIGKPANFSDADLKKEAAYGGKHFLGKDCVSCHQTPKEGADEFKWDHSSVDPKACLPCHFDKGNTKHGQGGSAYNLTGFGNCHTCHTNFNKSQTRNWQKN